MLGDLAKRELAGTRFADVRWVASTGSTNADVLALARGGGAEGLTLVAEHQTAGRGRQGRTWSAPPGAALLASILLRPPVASAGQVTMAVAVAAAEAVEELAGFRPRLKWPNDLVWPGDGSAPDRKLAGILAEADWSAPDRVAVVVGIGLNVRWPADLPDELAGIAIAINHITDRAVDREELLIALLRRLDRWYGAADLLARWRALSATIGREVRVELVGEHVVGTAVDVDEHGHLIVETSDGGQRVLAVGDVVHLWAA